MRQLHLFPLPERVRVLRQGLGLTPGDLARRAGCSEADVLAVEGGSAPRSFVRSRLVRALADAAPIPF